jgi:SAM-dependent methyltransferase
MTSAEQHEPHSAAWFGELRDYWWNVDHLALIAARFELGAVRSVLDVGCGVGHWGRLLAAVLPGDAMVVGVDREPKWVSEAIRLAAQRGFADRFRYQEGVAEGLPFENGSFDLVTCQTLLIHVRDARAVLQEMLRVTKPGGWLLAAEPNNLAGQVVSTSANAEASVDRLRFALTCERGKVALGEGDSSIGDLLPGYLSEVGAVGVQTFVSDMTSAVFPPYDSDEQRALCAWDLEQARLEQWVWPREQARRYFCAGGGTDGEFEGSSTI